MRDYVRRGFNNLDAIMQDYDGKEYEKVAPKFPSVMKTTPRSAMEDVLREWYGGLWEDDS